MNATVTRLHGNGSKGHSRMMPADPIFQAFARPSSDRSIYFPADRVEPTFARVFRPWSDDIDIPVANMPIAPSIRSIEDMFDRETVEGCPALEIEVLDMGTRTDSIVFRCPEWKFVACYRVLA